METIMHCEQVLSQPDDYLDAQLARALYYHFVESGRIKSHYPRYLLDAESTEVRGEQLPAADASFETELTIDRLVTAIRRMPSDQRAVFCLHDIDAYTFNEISMILNASEATVKTRLEDARSYLREKIMEPFS